MTTYSKEYLRRLEEEIKALKEQKDVSPTECNHEKVYANYILTSNPPQYPWICKKCGETGTDVGTLQTNEYEVILKKFNK